MSKNIVNISCSRCVLDSNDYPDIKLDSDGICDICKINDQIRSKYELANETKEQILDNLISEIKQNGKQKEYNCIIGVSGGVDSSYLAHYVKSRGLRPLAIHLDNGWNSELAVKNIETLLKNLDIDLITYVINWNEFRDLQLSFFKASVVDIEMLTDHAINAVLYKFAYKYDIKYILSGENFSSEGYLPPTWVHNKNDLINIKAIHKKFGTIKLKTFPTLGFIKLQFFQRIKRIKCVPILNYIDYNKSLAKELLINEFGWRDYGGKHYESIFTRFYQSHILPEKFNIDKRKSHLSALICSGQISKEMAIAELKKPIILQKQLEEDKEFVLKKLGYTYEDFNNYIISPAVSHYQYASFLNILNKLRRVKKKIKRYILQK